MTDPTPLSPQAQAVLDAATSVCMYRPDREDMRLVAAVALLAAADQLAQSPVVIGEPLMSNAAKDMAVVHLTDLLAIAAELDNTNTSEND